MPQASRLSGQRAHSSMGLIESPDLGLPPSTSAKLISTILGMSKVVVTNDIPWAARTTLKQERTHHERKVIEIEKFVMVFTQY